MGLKQGYKNSEVGIIPEDWEVKSIGNILKIIGGGGFKSKNNSKFGIKWLKISNVGINEIIWDDTSYLPIEFAKDNNFLLNNGDYVIALTRPLLDKKLKIAKLNQFDVPALLNQRVGKIEVNDENEIRFAYYLMQRFDIIERLHQSMLGTDPPNLSNKGIYSIICSVPSKKVEQIAVAEALSDTDVLINILEKLITKKRLIKQGAIQKLLKPKIGWMKKKLGSIGKTYGGLSGKVKSDFVDGKYPYIPFMNIMKYPVIDISYFDRVNIKVEENQNKALKGDLFFNGSSETPEEIGMCSVLLEDVPNLFLNSFCFGYRLNKDSKDNELYLSYFFRSSEGRKLFYTLAQGATRYNLSKSNFVKIEISLPSSKQQIEIATILSDMDSEIEALEKKLDKYRKIKTGMMQNLLTGKIRLV